MRSLLPIVFLGLLTAPVQSQELEGQMRACRERTVPAERLECLDAIALPDRPAPQGLSGGGGQWLITEDRSPLDDSPSVRGYLPANGENPQLAMMIRCREGRTEAFLTSQAFLGVGQGIQVQYRMGQAPAARATWSPSQTGKGAFAPQGSTISFIRSIPSDGTMFVRVVGYSQNAEGTFETRGVDEVRRKVSAACRWPADGARRR